MHFKNFSHRVAQTEQSGLTDVTAPGEAAFTLQAIKDEVSFTVSP